MEKSQPILDYERMPGWEAYAANLRIDFQQCLEEGRDVAGLEKLVETVMELPLDAFRDELADCLYRAFERAPRRPHYRYEEPSELAEIRRARPAGRVSLPEPDPAMLRDRVTGAWLGRICGCLLGKPVEGYRADAIRTILRTTGNEPLRRYMESRPDLPALLGIKAEDYEKRCWIDKIQGCAPIDDDTNYTVLAAKCLLEQYGRDFTPRDAAQTWLDCQTKRWYCTAERVAYVNLTRGMAPPHSAVYKNAFREWIGAQIRGDYFGYVNPGDPQTAADMAWRDACISHTRNGIYGEMLVAAMLAAAAVCKDPERVLRAGLGEIPAKSRLTEALESVINQYHEGVSAEACFAGIHALYDEKDAHHWCHTISNAMIVAAALLYGELDYGKSICMAVEAGFDTDCNGATVGSAVGMMLGAGGIPEAWTRPMAGMLETSIAGIGRIAVSELTELTLRHMP